MPVNINEGGNKTYLTPNTTERLFKSKQIKDTPDVCSIINDLSIKYQPAWTWNDKKIDPSWNVVLNLKDDKYQEDFIINFSEGNGITSNLLNTLMWLNEKHTMGIKGLSIYLKLYAKDDKARLFIAEDHTGQVKFDWYFPLVDGIVQGVPKARDTGEIDTKTLKPKLDWNESNAFWKGIVQKINSKMHGIDYTMPAIPDADFNSLIELVRGFISRMETTHVADKWDTKWGIWVANNLPNHVQFGVVEQLFTEKAHRPLTYKYPFVVPRPKQAVPQDTPDFPPMDNTMPSALPTMDAPNLPDFDDLPF